MRHLVRVLACLSLLTFGSGCANDRIVDVLPIGGRQELRKGDLDVQVDNASGSVSVLVVNGSEPIVRVRPVHASPGRRSAPVDLGRASFVRTATGCRLRVATKGSDGPVHVEITVPQCAAVTIRNSNGPVNVRGSSGPIDIQNHSTGDFAHVDVRTDRNLDRPLSIHSEYGDILLHAGEESAGAITSHTPRGRTFVSAAHLRLREVSHEHEFFQGTLNAGTTAWKFDSSNGSVRLTFDRKVEPLIK